MPVINYTEKFFNIKESYITRQCQVVVGNGLTGIPLELELT